MASIKEVAEKAGVSLPTVYKVFSNTYSTSDNVQERVLAAAKELGYVHKVSAIKQVPTGRSKVIGLVITDSAALNGFYNFIVRELVNELDRSGYRLITMYTEKDTISERDAIEIMVDRKVDGLILTPASKERIEIVDRLITTRFPLLQLFNHVYPELDTLLFDDERGTNLAVKNLIQCGHEKIMMLSRRSRHNRAAGYRKAFDEMGLSFIPDMIKEYAYDNSVKEMIKQHITAMKPTAIISVSEGISVCTIQALKELNLGFPEDMSLVAYDDFPWLAASGISAVSHPFESLGKLASQLILNRVAEYPQTRGGEPVTLVLDPVLVTRDSIKVLR